MGVVIVNASSIVQRLEQPTHKISVKLCLDLSTLNSRLLVRMGLSRMRSLIPRISSRAILPPVGAAKRLNYQLSRLYTNRTVSILRQNRASVVSVIPSQRIIVAIMLIACVLQISLPFVPNHASKEGSVSSLCFALRGK